jgi:hypothetical protein
VNTRRYLRLKLAGWLLDLAAFVEGEPETVDDLVPNGPTVEVRVYRVSDEALDRYIAEKTAARRARDLN